MASSSYRQWFTTQHVLVGLVAAAVIFPAISHSIRVLSSPVTLFFLSPFIVLSVLLAFVASNVGLGLVLDAYRDSSAVRAPTRLRAAARPLAFTTPAAWQAVLIRSQWSAKGPLDLPPLIPQHQTLSSSINQVINLIVRDFVLVWYQQISSSPTFPGAVSKTIHAALDNILHRLTRIDLPTLIVNRILPRVTAHIEQFRQSEMAVRGAGLERHLTQSDELDMLLASRYAAHEPTNRLHPAVSNLSTMSTKQTEEAHLRSIVDGILPLILPEKEANSKAVHIVAREVVSCIVLWEVMELLSDPDVWNRAIDEAAGAAIRQQKLISKVRSILDTEPTGPQPSSPPASQTEHINSRTGIRHFESFLKSISRTDSLLDARRLKNDITNEIRKTRLLLANHENEELINGEKTEDIVAYLDRLYTAKKKVEKRIELLGGAADDSRQSVMMDSPSVSQARHSLREILANPNALSYFMEFMDRRNRSSMVQFWLHVESFKNPLESVESGDESGDEGALKAPGISSVSGTVKDDIKGIYEMYFANPIPGSPLVKIINPRRVARIREFAEPNGTPTLPQERRVRRSVLLAQRQVEKEMDEDFSDFERSDLWFRAVHDMEPKRSSAPLPPAQGQKSPEIPTSSPIQELVTSPVSILRSKPKSAHRPTFLVPAPGIRRAETAPVLSGGTEEPDELPHLRASKTPTNLDLLFGATEAGSQDDRSPLFAEKPITEEEEQSQRMEAIQAALTDIIADERRQSERPLSMASSDGTLNQLGALERTSVEDEQPGRRKRMFDDVDDHDEEEEADEEEESSRANASFEPALPGDLQLSYDIAKLTEKILKLQSQETILETLIRKAELTGDGQELRLLNKSKSAMGRELRALTFQRAQYEEQEAENRLVPDRTRVAIRNTSSTEEDGKSVTRYLIEVQQLAVDGTFASGWIVARRYNEFFAMHQRLKEKYVAVRALEFPGKRLVTSMSNSFVDSRRVGLEKYMQHLISIRLVCESEELRAFLSRKSPMVASQPVTNVKTSVFSDGGIVRTMYRSVTESIDDIFFGPSMLDVMIQRLSRQVADFAGIAGPGVNDEDLIAQAIASSKDAPEITLSKLPGDLKPLEGESAVSSFTAPICDLILAVFELDKKNNWLRRQAIVIILQQVLGGTIERKLREVVKGNTDEAHLLQYIGHFNQALWPGGKLKPPGIPRTKDEKTKTRDEANRKLTTLMPDLAANMIGRSNARRGARRMFAVLQNKRLNQHLVYTVFDEVIAALFPEAVFSPS
ncbi:related to intermediate filament protein MDM1 [Serendipita indica DSM 11827]|uniref:Related to intermediate filament protein MDM1 n=1 Tax=Serendipita indica (strain DSM 11827) TaxID=1109443 RepID=G4TMR3_SERID|nr:related to intermediate filament protein MDM1 [Serendipita indica DSM 11827]